MRQKRTSTRGFAQGLLAAALVLAAAPPQDAAAQKLTGFPRAEAPRYTVELIVFKYAEDAITSNELFVPDSPPFEEFMTAGSAGQADSEVPVFGDRPAMPSAEPALPRAAPADESSAAEEPANEITGLEHNLQDIPLRARIELALLSPEQYSMDEIYEELVELEVYQPIMRAAWTQTTPGQAESPAIRLHALGEPPPGLHGTVKLYQGRFVHLGIDLELDAEGVFADGGAVSDRRSATDRAIARSAPGSDDRYGSSGGESRQPIPVYSDTGYSEEIYIGDGGFVPQPVRYRIDEVRIMRDGDIRYYDHPRFGVIAKLTEIPGDPEETSPRASD
jgi:Peptidoglycan-binding protein, CsiV